METTPQMPEPQNNVESTAGAYKLYSAKSVWMVTLLASPIAGGFLMRQNFINMGKSREGNISLIASILYTAVFFAVIIMLPENIIDKIPDIVTQLLNTLLVAFFFDRSQGAAVREHKAKGGAFYSGWRAFGISMLIAAILVVVLFALALFTE